MVKLPPIEKIYEAYSAIADKRVILGENAAKVLSSDRQKEYIVTFNENTYTSTDSATYWQAYAGYPVIAVLMMQGILPLSMSTSAMFSGINWKRLNDLYKRDYKKAADSVFDDFNCTKDEKAAVRAEANRVFDAIKALDITLKRGYAKKSKKEITP